MSRRRTNRAVLIIKAAFANGLLWPAVKTKAFDCATARIAGNSFMLLYLEKRIVIASEDEKSTLPVLQRVAKELMYWYWDVEMPKDDVLYRHLVSQTVGMLDENDGNLSLNKLTQKPEPESGDIFFDALFIAVAAFGGMTSNDFQHYIEGVQNGVYKLAKIQTSRAPLTVLNWGSFCRPTMYADVHRAAVDGGCPEIVDTLLSNAGIGHYDLTVNTLRHAAERGDLGLVQLILDIHWRAEYHTVILHTPNPDVCNILLETFGSSWYKDNWIGMLEHALRKGWTGIEQYHFEQGDKMNQYLENLLLVCEIGRQDLVEMMLLEGYAIRGGELCQAALHGHLGIVKILLEHGAHTLYGDVVAVYGNHMDVLIYLLEYEERAVGFWVDENGTKFPYIGKEYPWEEAQGTNEFSKLYEQTKENGLPSRIRPFRVNNINYYPIPDLLTCALGHENKDMFRLLVKHGHTLELSGIQALVKAIEHSSKGYEQMLHLVKEQAINERLDRLSTALEEYDGLRKWFPDILLVKADYQRALGV